MGGVRVSSFPPSFCPPPNTLFRVSGCMLPLFWRLHRAGDAVMIHHAVPYGTPIDLQYSESYA